MSVPSTNTASGATSAAPLQPPGLSGVTGVLQGGVSNLITTGSGYIDRFFPPQKRDAWKNWLVKFATEKPYIASFLLSQLALSGPPLALFILMTITVVIFALLAGILVGLIGALLFIVAAIGFALIILLPTLFFTTGAAVFFWLWGMGAYYIVKWFNEKPIPGIHTDLKGGLAEASGVKDLPGLNGESLMGDGGANGERGGEEEEKEEEEEEEQAPPRKERPAKEGGEGKTTGAQHHSDGQENSISAQRKVKKPEKSGGGADGEAKDGVGGATSKVGL